MLVTLISAVETMNLLKYFLLYLFLHIIKWETAIPALNLFKGQDSKIIEVDEIFFCCLVHYLPFSCLINFFLINSFTSKYVRVGHIFNLFN